MLHATHLAALTRLTAAVQSEQLARIALDDLRLLLSAVYRRDEADTNLLLQRDAATSAADRLAYALYPADVIGEHTNMNCPWDNAAELLEAAAAILTRSPNAPQPARENAGDEASIQAWATHHAAYAAHANATIAELREELRVTKAEVLVRSGELETAEAQAAEVAPLKAKLAETTALLDTARTDLKHRNDDYRELASHHNTYCTCMELYG